MTEPPAHPGDDDVTRPPLPSWQPPAADADPAADPQLRAEALKRLQARKDFRTHVTVYLAVLGLLVGIWLVSGGGYFWPVWPAMGWGLAVVLHGASLSWDKEPTEAEIAAQARRILEQRGGGRPATDPRRLDGPQDSV
ncbi:2TM domain-containing protein [Ornithinimicrobium pekingense]|uniref:2TM domain-containing protein n=1 Tax=Ornithinimicrobium pekingense TaxID=384677 RepID=A0ABQ2F6J0_9MICO|nr:2TM domain-containing protein [Ornithinimicrobium pekingense]GGK64626.1 hypothetical protein GCM10011509_11150 [Ornithinimicrobium pekingense]